MQIAIVIQRNSDRYNLKLEGRHLKKPRLYRPWTDLGPKMSHKKAPKYYYLDRKWHFCPGLNSATKFTKLTIFRDGLAQTGKFAKLTIFRDDLTKAKKFTNLTIFRDTLTKSGAADFTVLTAIAKFTNFTIFSSESSAVFTTCSPSLGK